MARKIIKYIDNWTIGDILKENKKVQMAILERRNILPDVFIINKIHELRHITEKNCIIIYAPTLRLTGYSTLCHNQDIQQQ